MTMGIETPVRRARLIALGALGGALLFCVFFGIELGRTNIQFMGTSDADAVRTIVGRYQGRIVGQQALLLALALVVGGTSGALGGWYSSLTNRLRRGRGAFAFGIAGALVVHAYFGLRSLATYPALYVESLFDGGPLLRRVMIALTSWFTPLRVDLVFGALFAVLLLRVVDWRWVRPRLRALSALLAAALAIVAWQHRAHRFTAAAKPDKPHVFLIAVDSLRADRVFGERAARDFPTLASLAQRSVRFREAFVTVPRTFSSFVTLLTGRFPQHHGIRHMFPRPEARAAVGATLATAASQAGYRTLAVSDYAGEIFTRTALGFQTVDAPYFDIRTIVDQRSLQGHPNLLPYATSPRLARLFPAVAALPERADPSLLVDKALAAIDAQPDKQPLFLTLFFSTAHFPYAAPAPFYRRFSDPSYDGPFRYSKLPLVETKDDADIRQIRALYDGAVAATDSALGDFLKQLERRDLLRNSVIVLLADHGEELYDVKQNGMGHGDHLEGAHANHVPLLILDGRGKLQPRDVDALVRDVDVAPTLATMLGLPSLSADGVDLSPLLRGEKQDLELFSYSETELWLTESGPGFPVDKRLPYPGVTGVTELLPDGDIVLQSRWEPLVIAGKHRVLRTKDWKLVYRPTPTGPEWSLYDRRADPEEQHDIKAERPLLFPLLQKQLEAWIALDGSERRGGYLVPPERLAPATATSASAAAPQACARLLECAGQAAYEGELDAKTALTLARYPQHFVSRWSGLAGDVAYRVASIALTIPDVARYPAQRRPGSTRLDPVWNRTRGVYESKGALVNPSGGRYRFALPDGATTLSTTIATLPGDPATVFTVEVDGKLVHSVTADDRALPSGAWHAQQIDLPAGRELQLKAATVRNGKRRALGFWGMPVLVPKTPPQPPTNVLVVLIDTLRADALAVMPNLRALAERGARFDQAISCATWTRPALVGLYGGDLPSRLGHGAEEMIPSSEERSRFYRLAPALLPRALVGRGYDASAIGNNFFLLGYPQIGLDLGFEEVTDIRHPQLDTPAITRAVEDYFERHKQRPFLLHVHYDTPHWPYTPPPELQKTIARPPGFPEDSDSDRYLAEAAFADQHLGLLLAALDRSGLRERTLVVVLGDHGEVFDHAHDHIVKALDLPTLHHHGWSAYDEVVRVPLVLAGPGVPAGKQITAPVSIIDVVPTLTALLKQPPLADQRLGRSLLPLLGDPPGAAPPRDLFVEGQNVRLLRTPTHAYLRRRDGRVQVGKVQLEREEELYDVVADPRQHRDLIAAAPALRADLRRRFEKLAPNLADPAGDLVHLRIDPSDRDLIVEGTLESDRPLHVAAASSADAAPLSDRKLRVTLRAPATLDLWIAPDAELRLDLRKNGSPVRGNELELGRYALPLLRGPTTIAATQQHWLDALVPPPTSPGRVVLWRERASQGGSLPVASERSDGDVATMMKRWGYAK